MKIHRSGWVYRLLTSMSENSRILKKERDMLEEAVGNAYEGLIITDADGFIIKTNKAYATYLGEKQEDMIGRHVTDIVENTRMHIVARTGVPEIAQIQKIRGHEMICSRIPIFENGKVVAVVGKIIFQNVDDLFAMTKKFSNLKKELEFYKNELNKRLGAKYSFSNIVGKNKELESVKALGARVAKSDTTVLLKGESGTGKELFAHSIHIESNRALGPFIKVNCAAIPESLFESELFGYKEGAFTGAHKQGKKGKFALADKGTIFLDEISELPLSMQVKLLRVLQEREIEPVGAEQTEPVDVRIIAATNKDLESQVKQGEFRSDLYYRLNVVKLEIPPLRERKDDIPLLIEKILKQLEKETGIPVENVDKDVEAMLTGYSWPGNVRELRNVLEQALYVKNSNIITLHDLPRSLSASVAEIAAPKGAQSLKSLLQQTEEQIIHRILREEKGNKLSASSRLGISKSSLYAKIEQYRIVD
jgi:transcriptional regulator with PAS, ATPase and Fis domain